ncbi:hypothetical protein SAMN06298221_106113 [Sphaerochaeta associata]|nr:hypothetical protein SAMN06298221_106113 [Sphaerochaeta associata]
MKRTILSFAVMIIVILLVSFLLIAMVGSDIPTSLASFFVELEGRRMQWLKSWYVLPRSCWPPWVSRWGFVPAF